MYSFTIVMEYFAIMQVSDNLKRIMENNWRYKTVESLEKRSYGDPNGAPTNMVRRCLKLCKVPLDAFNVGDLGLMIAQQFVLQYLIPLAIEHLREDIFVEGDFYPGDLLNNVLAVNPEFWVENKHLWIQINDLIKDRKEELTANRIAIASFYIVL